MQGTEIELAYLAGVMDSDGTFTISVNSWRTVHQNRPPSYVPRALCAQVEPEAVDLAQSIFGGSINSRKNKGGKRSLFQWSATNKQAGIVIRALLPFLRIKKKQAEIVLQLCDLKSANRSWLLTTPDKLVKMHELAIAVKTLNHSQHYLAPIDPNDPLVITAAALKCRAKLTREQAEAIRLDNRLHHIIAKEFGVSRPTVSNIKAGRIWSPDLA